MSNNQNTSDRKTQRLALSALKHNAANPRKISDDKFKKLVDSLLIFPRMLDLRPAVVDGTNTVLGGNMRLRALDTIAQMTPEELAERLGHIRQYKSKKKAEKEYLQSYWASFLDKPECPVLHADDLTPEQVKEFIVKDNVAFGSWDWDELGNTWDSEDLSDWGLDVWSESSSVGTLIDSGLPAEIEGLDLSPEEIPVIEGSDQTAMERVIIVYPKDRTAEIEKLLGVEKLEKVLYSIDELCHD